MKIAKRLKWILIFIGCCWCVPSWGAYVPHTTWSESKPKNWDVLDELQFLSSDNRYERKISQAQITRALTDFENRIDPAFRVPKGLRNYVEFWLKIYTQYSSLQSVVYDKANPETVYEVIDFLPLWKRSRNRFAFAIQREKILIRKLEAYRRAFLALGKGKKPDTPEAKNILQQPERCPHHRSYLNRLDTLRFQTGQRDFIIQGIHRADPFFPTIQTIFREASLPTELTRIPLVESSFNYKAISRADARGVWQFMQDPGNLFLAIDTSKGGIDERLNPIKSSIAATKLLKQNRQLLGNWFLAITAYHSGYYGITKIPRSLRSVKKLGEVFGDCSRKVPLGHAGRNYYAEFLAILHAETYRDIFYGVYSPKRLQKVEIHTLKAPITGVRFASENTMSVELFRRLNPDISDLYMTLPKGTRLIRPTLTAKPFQVSQDLPVLKSRTGS